MATLSSDRDRLSEKSGLSETDSSTPPACEFIDWNWHCEEQHHTLWPLNP